MSVTMEALWNKLDLKRPSANSWKVSSEKIGKFKKLTSKSVVNKSNKSNKCHVCLIF